MVQFCLSGVEEIDAFKAVMHEIALTEKLKFYDGSARTEADLESIAEVQPGVPIAHPTVNIGTESKDGVDFGAGNFAEAPDQIVIGFSNGLGANAKRDLRARKMSDSVVAALQRHWRVHEVPNVETNGAFPLENCAVANPPGKIR